MLRLLLVTSAMLVGGLQVGDAPEPRAELLGAQVVSTLDPEMTNTKGETFHVPNPGEYVMIAMPPEVDVSNPRNADLMIKADFAQVGSGCDDLLIRSITLQGKRLGADSQGSALSSLKFFVADDRFNETAALGLQAASTSGEATTYSVEDFLRMVPQVKIVRPRGNIHKPTKQSYRKRQHIFHATATLSGPHEIQIFWSTVWRGPGEYANDISFTISGVGSAPAGLLGTDDHTEATKVLNGCFKKQPVSGSYQVHQRKHHA